MLSSYRTNKIERALLTLDSILETIDRLNEWNQNVGSVSDYACSPSGMQLLAANCTLLVAIGEGVNRIDKALPEFLSTYAPEIPWSDVVSMRNRIAHGYFELDANVVFETIKNDIPMLKLVLTKASSYLRDYLEQ